MQNAELLLPRRPGRLSWPHALLHEHLQARLMARDDSRRLLRAAAEALTHHPQAGTRRVVRQRVVNLIQAGDSDAAAQLLFDFLDRAWNGPRDPLAALSDLDLFKGRLQGRSLAMKHRWQAEALRHVARAEEAAVHAEIARASFEEQGDKENLAHTLRLLGHLHCDRGTSTEGLELVEHAAKLFGELNHTAGLAQCDAVLAEIHYLLGHYDEARRAIESADERFEKLEQPLGRGQSLLLLSWIEHSEGRATRARRMALEARGEFEHAGYRMGVAQANASLAHVEHRLLNYYSAELGAEEALAMFTSLQSPRGEAACERLLAMIAVDVDDSEGARQHAAKAKKLYEHLGDPWGVIEATLLLAQAALAEGDLTTASRLLKEPPPAASLDPEPRQHLLVTRAWLHLSLHQSNLAADALVAASQVYGEASRSGDHTPHLLARLARFAWPDPAATRLKSWRSLLADRQRKSQE